MDQRTRAAFLMLVAFSACAVEKSQNPNLEGGSDALPEAPIEEADDAGNESAPPDASEAAPDALHEGEDVPMDARPPPTAATIAFVVHGVPQVGMPVVFHHPDGTVRTVAETDGDGRLTAAVSPDELLTTGGFFGGEYAAYSLVTVVGVEPGDEIRIGNPGRTAVGTARVALPGPYAGASLYYADFCGDPQVNDPSVPQDFDVFSSCITPDGDLRALAIARDSTGQVLAYAAVPSVAFEEGSTSQITFPSWEPWDVGTTATYERTAVRVPEDVFAARINASFIARAVAFNYPGFGAAESVEPGGSSARNFRFPNGIADGLSTTASVSFGTEQNPLGWSSYDRRDAFLAPEANIDLASVLLPRVGGVTMDSADLARPRVAWTTASPAVGDSVSIGLSWMDEATFSHYWTVVLPATTARTFQFPELPEELAVHRPTGVISDVQLTVMYQESSWVDDYSTVLAHIGTGVEAVRPPYGSIARMSAGALPSPSP